MFDNSFFDNIGIYSDSKFLERQLCLEVCQAISVSDQVQSPLPEFHSGEDIVRTETRPKISTSTDDDHLKIVKNKLEEVLPELEQFFRLKLSSVQPPYFGIYAEGDFMKRHIDVVGDGKMNDFGPNRIVSIIIYLNDETEKFTSGSYGGGNLMFHDVLKTPGFEEFGYPIKGEAGKLIAFPSTAMHEVTPVTHGKRYVVSSGYF